MQRISANAARYEAFVDGDYFLVITSETVEEVWRLLRLRHGLPGGVLLGYF